MRKNGSDSFNYYQMFDKAKEQVKKILSSSSTSSHNRILYFKKMFEMMNEPDVSKKALDLYDVYNNAFLESMTPCEYVRPLFDFCHSHDIKIGICTDMMCQVQLSKLCRLGLSSDIDSIVTSEEVGVEKPNVKIYQRVLDSFGDQCLDHYTFIGDDKEKDVDGPKSFGMDSMDVKELMYL